MIANIEMLELQIVWVDQIELFSVYPSNNFRIGKWNLWSMFWIISILLKLD